MSFGAVVLVTILLIGVYNTAMAIWQNTQRGAPQTKRYPGAPQTKKRYPDVHIPVLRVPKPTRLELARGMVRNHYVPKEDRFMITTRLGFIDTVNTAEFAQWLHHVTGVTLSVEEIDRLKQAAKAEASYEI